MSEHERLRSGGSALDFIGAIQLFGLACAMMLLIFSLVGEIILLVVPLWLLAYLHRMVFLPITQSQPSHLKYEPLGNIPVRVSKTLPTHVIRILFREIIVVNYWDLSSRSNTWKAMVAHELSHVKRGDLSYFHFLGVLVGILACLAVLPFGAIVIGFINYTNDPSIYCILLIVASYFGIPLCLSVFIIHRSLIAREYDADAYAFYLEPDITVDWLRRAARREKQGSALQRYLFGGAWFTHPSFTRRLKEVEGEQVRIVSSAGSAIEAFVVLIVGLYITLIVPISFSYFKVDTYLHPVFWIFFIAYFALLLGSSLGYCSLQIERVLVQNGITSGLQFCAMFTTVLCLAYISTALLVDYYNLGSSEANNARIQELFPGAPQGAIKTPLGESLVLIVLVPSLLTSYCLLMNVALRKVAILNGIRGLVHIIIGLISILMAASTVKIIYALLFNR